jgi:hypothetical protein
MFRKIFIIFIVQFFLLTNISYPGPVSLVESGKLKDTTDFPFVLGIKQHYGFIILHTKAISQLKGSYPWAIEADFSWHLVGKKVWEAYHFYPRIGFFVSYFNFDNSSILGSGWSVIGYTEPFFMSHKKINFSIKGGAGLSYLTNPYDEIDNPDNLSYCLPLGGFVILNFGLNYRINQKLNLNIAATYNHISNGGVKQPNKGINFPTLTAGIDYTFNPVEFKKRPKIKLGNTDTIKKRIDFILFGTTKAIGTESKRYPVFGACVKVSKRIKRLSALTIGAEWIVNDYLKQIIKKNNGDDDHQRASVLLGHEFLMGKFIFSQQLGIYVYIPFRDNDPVYQRYGLAYRITDRMYAGINIKAHRHVADFTDIRIGFCF